MRKLKIKIKLLQERCSLFGSPLSLCFVAFTVYKIYTATQSFELRQQPFFSFIL